MSDFLKVLSQVFGVRAIAFSLSVFTCILALSTYSPAQSGRTKASNENDDDEEVIKIRTDEILVPVSIRDQSGMTVAGLKPESFFVYDNGDRQEILSFNRQRVPANIVMLLDASGSVFSRMRFIREAAKHFLVSLLPEDKACVMQFADEVELLQDWTSGDDTKSLIKAIEWRYHPGRSTTFYDGLYLAAENQLKHVEGRRIVILLTDGIDSAEHKRASFSDSLNAIKRSETTVYVVSLTKSLRVEIGKQDHGWLGNVFGGADKKQIARAMAMLDDAETLLETLTTETGGRMFLPVKEDDLVGAYKAIAEELRSQYVLTFKPKKRAAAGEYRRIKVLVSPGTYEVATRDGYYGRN